MRVLNTYHQSYLVIFGYGIFPSTSVQSSYRINSSLRWPESTSTLDPSSKKAEQHLRIIPQAVSVRYGLAIGARCVPVVLALMYFFGVHSLFSLPFLHPSSSNPLQLRLRGQ